MIHSRFDLLAAPELAILAVLDAALEIAAMALVAAHLDALDPNVQIEAPGDPRKPERHAVTVARKILVLGESLRREIAGYTHALDDARERQHRENIPF